MGFIILGFSLHTIPGFTSGLLYLTIYLFTTVAFLGLLMQFELKINLDKSAFEFKQLFSLQYYNQHRAHCLALMITLLSFGGVPPLAGFFIKWSLLEACLFSAHNLLGFLVFLLSVLALGFYLRMLRLLVLRPLLLSYSQQPLRSILLSLREQPLSLLLLLSAIVLFLLVYGLVFHQLLLLFFHDLSIHSFNLV